MRIALVVPDSQGWRSRGSARESERSRVLAERLAADGHEVRVFCTQFWPGYEQVLRHEGVAYHGVTVAPARTSFTARLPALLARYGPDVVQTAPRPASVVLGARAGARLARSPLVVGWTDEVPPGGRLARRAATAPDGALVPSELVGRRVMEYGTPDDRVRRVPQAVDCERVRAVDPDPTYDVVAATPLDEDANLDSLLLALAELRDRDWSALVVGSGAGRAGVADQLDSLRIADRVTLAGDLSRDERLAYYRGAHVFVQTRRHVSFARELLWVLVAGCVGVVEYQGGSSAHELVERRERGVRVTSPEELEAVIAGASDRERRDYDPTFERYDWERVLAEHLEFYRELGA
ncbi:glycosyltransferase family 4 protein [Halomarina litorea]|uniref:glycosyltransferase family 4 protein n=1 Tax=Halomarina litorea TaxID=2961595 RepID=UPI0020C3ACE0|nr:glycosyltransferase family 4 protein [Halomarina sp. BCD28]